MVKKINDFVILFRQKGYRGKFKQERSFFSMDRRPLRPLEDILKEWLVDESSALSKRAGIYLSYELYSGLHSENVDCRFHIVYSQSGRICVTELRAELESKREHRLIRVDGNHRLPGSAILPTFLPRPSPWDDIKRGRLPKY